jgi:hypothetical protein
MARLGGAPPDHHPIPRPRGRNTFKTDVPASRSVRYPSEGKCHFTFIAHYHGYIFETEQIADASVAAVVRASATRFHTSEHYLATRARALPCRMQRASRAARPKRASHTKVHYHTNHRPKASNVSRNLAACQCTPVPGELQVGAVSTLHWRQVQDRLILTGLDRDRGASFASRDPRKARGVAARLRNRPANPVLRLLPSARPMQGHRSAALDAAPAYAAPA